ncbi:MAG TPA: response regulator transcription factor [Candidatus Dormibacteraeota bacterium]|nr:response regulator transcription factor [Candidatus Dormibacteraeota bacterium]
MSKVLVVDDDEHIRASLRRTLAFEGYQVREAGDGAGALEATLDELPDLVILDVMLPGMDGMEVCRRLREVNDVPILMLTAREGTSSQVQGLDAGADDYLVKPFVKDELLARIRALLRRRAPNEGPRSYQVADLALDDRSHRVFRGEREVELTPREFELLRFLMRHPGEVIPHGRLLAAIWGYQDSRVLDVYVRYLRTKLEAAGESRLVHTVRGVGYVLRAH